MHSCSEAFRVEFCLTWIETADIATPDDAKERCGRYACVFRRLLLTENPAVREQMLSAFRWLLRVIRQDGALSNDKSTFVLGKEAIVHTSSGQTQLLTDSTCCCLHMLCKVLAFCLQWYKLFSGLYCHTKLVHSPGVKKRSRCQLQAYHKQSTPWSDASWFRF